MNIGIVLKRRLTLKSKERLYMTYRGFEKKIFKKDLLNIFLNGLLSEIYFTVSEIRYKLWLLT